MRKADITGAVRTTPGTCSTDPQRVSDSCARFGTHKAFSVALVGFRNLQCTRGTRSFRAVIFLWLEILGVTCNSSKSCKEGAIMHPWMTHFFALPGQFIFRRIRSIALLRFTPETLDAWRVFFHTTDLHTHANHDQQHPQLPQNRFTTPPAPPETCSC